MTREEYNQIIINTFKKWDSVLDLDSILDLLEEDKGCVDKFCEFNIDCANCLYTNNFDTFCMNGFSKQVILDYLENLLELSKNLDINKIR